MFLMAILFQLKVSLRSTAASQSKGFLTLFAFLQDADLSTVCYNRLNRLVFGHGPLDQQITEAHKLTAHQVVLAKSGLSVLLLSQFQIILPPPLAFFPLSVPCTPSSLSHCVTSDPTPIMDRINPVGWLTSQTHDLTAVRVCSSRKTTHSERVEGRGAGKWTLRVCVRICVCVCVYMVECVDLYTSL